MAWRQKNSWIFFAGGMDFYSPGIHPEW